VTLKPHRDVLGERRRTMTFEFADPRPPWLADEAAATYFQFMLGDLITQAYREDVTRLSVRVGGVLVSAKFEFATPPDSLDYETVHLLVRAAERATARTYERILTP